MGVLKEQGYLPASCLRAGPEREGIRGCNPMIHGIESDEIHMTEHFTCKVHKGGNLLWGVIDPLDEGDFKRRAAPGFIGIEKEGLFEGGKGLIG